MTGIEKNFTQDILREVLALFNADSFETTRHESSDSLVLEYSGDSTPRILKIIDPAHRPLDTLLGEIEFLDYLKAKGLGVCAAVASKNTRFVETVRAGDAYYLAVSFEKAPGSPAGEFEDAGKLVSIMGSSMGRLHALGRDFRFSRPEREREHWNEWGIVRNWREILPEKDARIGAKLEALLDRLAALPRDGLSYGITHADFHIDNFHIHEGKIYLYDFEHCEYGYFINDIAIALYYATFLFENMDGREVAKKFLSTFLKSYLEENALQLSWLDHAPDFLLLRKILLYLDVCKTPGMDENYRSFMETAHKHILEDTVSLGGAVVVRDFDPADILALL